MSKHKDKTPRWQALAGGCIGCITPFVFTLLAYIIINFSTLIDDPKIRIWLADKTQPMIIIGLMALIGSIMGVFVFPVFVEWLQEEV